MDLESESKLQAEEEKDATALVSFENTKSAESKEDDSADLVETKEDVQNDKNLPQEGPDPKVMDFLRILDEYRLKCEEEGNYAEAERASKQLDNLRKQEMKRQIKALKARQISDRQDIQIAHNLQFAEFNAAWDKYMEEYDQMAHQYIKQMTERHASELLEFQTSLQKRLLEKPPKYSKELLEWRRRQHMLARQKNYAEAQKIKRIADMMENKEKGRLETEWQSTFSLKEEKFRTQQRAELTALLKRIDVRRKEHMAQRALDTKRLLQRNRNVQAVLGSKQSVEERSQTHEIKTRLSRPRNGVFGVGSPSKSGISSTGSSRQGKKGKSRKSQGNTFLTDQT